MIHQRSLLLAACVGGDDGTGVEGLRVVAARARLLHRGVGLEGLADRRTVVCGSEG